METVAPHRNSPGASLKALLWLKWRVTRNSYRRVLKRRSAPLIVVGLGAAFLLEVLLFVGLVGAVSYLRSTGFPAPDGFTWSAVALIPLYALLLMPSAMGVELQTQIDARRLLPYPVRVREIFFGAAVGRALGLWFPIPFLAPPIAAALVVAAPALFELPQAALAIALVVFQGIFLSQLITITFQSSVSSRRTRDAVAFVAVFVTMLVWAALQLWVFGNLGSREALVGRVSEGYMPPILAGRVMADPWGAIGLGALGLLAAETLVTFVVGSALSHYFLNIRVPTRSAARRERPIAVPRLALAPHGNLAVWKDRIYLRRDPLVKAAAYGTLMLVVVAIVSSATTQIADPRVAGGFFLAVFAFLAPWTFLSGLGANLFGVEDGLAFLLASPADRRAFLRGKAVFLIAVSTAVGSSTLAASSMIFDRLDLLPASAAFLFVISIGLTAAGLLSSSFFPSQAAREGFRRKTVSGAGLAMFTVVGLLFLVPIGFASGLPSLFGNRILLLATAPLAVAVEVVFLRSALETAVRRLERDEGAVLMAVKG